MNNGNLTQAGSLQQKNKNVCRDLIMNYLVNEDLNSWEANIAAMFVVSISYRVPMTSDAALQQVKFSRIGD